MKKNLLGILFLFPTLNASVVGNRSSNPTYIRFPKVYSPSQSILKQQRASLSSAPSQGQLLVKPILQSSLRESHVTHEAQSNDQALKRQEEIGSYTHMHGTSDTYGGIDLK